MSDIGLSSIDEYVEVLSSVAVAIDKADLESARQLLSPIAGQRWHEPFKLAAKSEANDAPSTAKRSVTDRDKAATYIRDGFVCRYCGHRVIPLAVLVGISDVFPDDFAYHTNYKRGEIHPAFWLAPETDHLLAHTRGGRSSIDNLVTLHAMCNLIKSDSYFEDLPLVEHPDLTEEWDGLVPRLPAIAAAGNGEHAGMIHRWTRLFEANSVYNSDHLAND